LLRLGSCFHAASLRPRTFTEHETFTFRSREEEIGARKHDCLNRHFFSRTQSFKTLRVTQLTTGPRHLFGGPALTDSTTYATGIHAYGFSLGRLKMAVKCRLNDLSTFPFWVHLTIYHAQLLAVASDVTSLYYNICHTVLVLLRSGAGFWIKPLFGSRVGFTGPIGLVLAADLTKHLLQDPLLELSSLVIRIMALKFLPLQ
jgi:hypothetical protein